MKHPFCLLPLLLTAAGCAAPPPPGPQVRILTQTEAKDCTYVMDLHDTINPATPPAGALAYARKAMILQAAQAGANAIVFGTARPTAQSAAPLSATAYDCPAKG